MGPSHLHNPAVLLCALLVPTLVLSRPTIDPGECPTAAALPLDSIEPASTEIPIVYEHSRSPALTVYVGSLQQMTRKAKATIALLSTLIAYVSINSLIHALRPAAFIWYEEDREERSWIASSRSWLDRKACRWLSVCGATHLQTADGEFGHRDPAKWASMQVQPETPWRSFWLSGANESEWDPEERARRQIPDYVFHYAPLVHLYSGEQFWPGDIAEHLYHTTPTLNYTPIQAQWDHPTLSDLHELNQWEKGRPVFLTSNDDVQTRPPWLEGERNIPETNDDKKESWADWDGRVDGDIPGDTEENRAKWYDFHQLQQEDASEPESNFNEHLQAQQVLKEHIRRRYGGEEIYNDVGAGGRSDAPAILVVMDKGNGIVDAFWFYFYSFNLGNTVVNVRFGNHVGDWEHSMVRFHNGKPKALFFSAHQGGEAYSYEAVEKIGHRPVIYSAEGSHAMYATAGVHEYILPWGLLHDITDRGPLWDPVLNSQAYTYDFDNEHLRASTFSPSAPTEWFHYRGHWGDKFYPLGDSRQYRFAGQYHYVNGPLGPKFKHLNRHKVCQGPDRAPCVIKNYIEQGKRSRRWGPNGPGE
ncbi:Vacuolar protein sorting-associated protein 62 [Penicillium paradoxum]|uniref:Vacuolar protein sorting-associated protein 62 n=1 Tax=Penicillium paradoxum TaxID=176176 RepID=UPI0025467302|nr:Vacuolar protein sorting-associated protein 62 [Penicillium paradoxum]KAJ5779172.1 Vacuolar protein sorting-associated protein 62 [Penicillium paradoxum]